MKYRVAALSAAAAFTLLHLQSASAADLPQIRTSDRNTVPDCATPGRLTAYLKSRNASLDPRFEKIAVEYMRHGEELNLRWDYAFFQMLMETGNLSFMRDQHRPGLVKPAQNNFAGLGAVGKGQHGETFPDVSTGVRAHLEHVLMYTGEPVDNPVAERTRKVMEWGVLTSWQKTVKGPMTYAHLAQQWAKSKSYADMIETVGERFYEQFCSQPDLQPDLVREARAGRGARPKAVADNAVLEEKPRPGVELARKAIEDGKAEDNNKRLGLGAASLLRAIGDLTKSDGDTATQDTKPGQDHKPGKDIAAKDTATTPRISSLASPKPDTGATKSAAVLPVSAGTALAKPIAPAAPKCHVWTASYGGAKAILIKAQSEAGINYTVLDVNEGSEKREADAYIAAYAKGGTITGEFSSQSQALDQAFELCPEG
ncbi:MAG: glucosaminidase domain-containing protein [Rhodospirillales bacterium]|nr:glucosaminidase domain-containing protein [Rhodospirillales bacterium]